MTFSWADSYGFIIDLFAYTHVLILQIWVMQGGSLFHSVSLKKDIQ